MANIADLAGLGTEIANLALHCGSSSSNVSLLSWKRNNWQRKVDQPAMGEAAAALLRFATHFSKTEQASSGCSRSQSSQSLWSTEIS